MKSKSFGYLLAVITAASCALPQAQAKENLKGHVSDGQSKGKVVSKGLKLARGFVIGVPLSAVRGSIDMVALGTAFGSESLTKRHVHKVPAVAISGALLGPGCALFGLVAGSTEGIDETLKEWRSE